MALVKSVLQKSLYAGLLDIFTSQASKATSGDEQEDPESVIKKISDDMATVISDAVDAYIKSGDISVGPTHISVTSPAGSCTVLPVAPAKMI